MNSRPLGPEPNTPPKSRFVRCCFLLVPVVYCSLLLVLTSNGIFRDLFLVSCCYSLLVLDLLSGCYQKTPLGATNQVLIAWPGTKRSITSLLARSRKEQPEAHHPSNAASPTLGHPQVTPPLSSPEPIRSISQSARTLSEHSYRSCLICEP